MQDGLDPVALASLAVSVVALAVAYHAIARGDKNSSAASLISLNEAFREAWGRYLSATDDAKQYEFAELANLLEIACAAHLDRAFKGNSGEILGEYLTSVFALLSDNPDAKSRLRLLIDTPTTFKYVRQYMRKHCK